MADSPGKPEPSNSTDAPTSGLADSGTSRRDHSPTARLTPTKPSLPNSANLPKAPPARSEASIPAAENPDSPPLPNEVAEEQRLLQHVLDTIQQLPSPPKPRNYRSDLIKLRDSLGEERLPEDRASIVEQMQRLARLAAMQHYTIQNQIDPSKPYFGRIVLQDIEGTLRSIFIGKTTFVHRDVTIVDWRDAPISRVFYEYQEGDEYELTIAGREIQGKVLVRRTLSIRDGRLLRVSTPEHVYVSTDEGWIDGSVFRPLLRGGEGAASRPDRTRPLLGVTGRVPSIGLARPQRPDKHLPEIASLLDPDQFDLITQPESRIIAIQGSAGSGKTTVALHRVAYLAFQDPKRFDPRRTLVVVFNRALANYISQVLPALGVQGVRVATYDGLTRELRQRHYPRLPKRYSQETPAVVTRLKHHSALIPMLAEAVLKRPTTNVIQLFEELFTNRSWLEEGFARHAPGTFRSTELDRVHRWCTRQAFTRMDGEGTTDEDLPSLDPEDDTIILRLHQLSKGPLLNKRKKPLRYRHLVIDEVQDLSPLELTVLLDTVSQSNPVTLAGDLAQKIVEESDFRSWEQVLAMLELDGVQLAPLQVSYRSTRAIMELARAVLGPLAPAEPVVAPREGAPVELFQFQTWGEAVTFLSDSLRHLIDTEPSANCAVLVRYPQRAEEIYRALDRSSLRTLHLVRDQEFSFAPGVEVTDVRQVKGLEFDYVVMFDCDQATYPVNPPSRHLLHVGITRAAHQCWLFSIGPPSDLLPNWLKAESVL